MTTFNNTLPIKPTDFDANMHVPYEKIKDTKQGGKYIWAKAKIKVPVMRLAFDANADEQQDGRMKYSMALSFLGSDTDTKIQSFREMCEALDNYNIDWATANSAELWNGEDLSNKRVIVEDRYTSMVKMPKKVEYSPTIKINMKTAYGSTKPDFQVFSNQKNDAGSYDEIDIWSEEEGLNLDLFKAKTSMATLIEYAGLYVVGKKIYPSWKLVQCQPKTDGISEKKFALDDSDDEETDKGVVVTDSADEDAPAFDDDE